MECLRVEWRNPAISGAAETLKISVPVHWASSNQTLRLKHTLLQINLHPLQALGATVQDNSKMVETAGEFSGCVRCILKVHGIVSRDVVPQWPRSSETRGPGSGFESSATGS